MTTQSEVGKRIEVLRSETTKPLGIAGFRGYIEYVRGEVFGVLVEDPIEGGFSGPFEVPKKDIRIMTDQEYGDEEYGE
ncbi:hypothetical protein HYZ98_04820 [Candidatus Peregrinibacteria bacterium]|nr:hypothetical protein [Candidatus Peregrinibacteria bacterium]